jgi:hypothetical protein
VRKRVSEERRYKGIVERNTFFLEREAIKMEDLITRLGLFLASFAIASLFVVCFAHAGIVPESMVAAWLLDEGEGNVIEDFSGNDHEGSIAGAIEWIDGKFGEAIEFSGGSINVPDHESLNFDDESFTVVIWFNFDESQDWNRLLRERTPSPWGEGNPGWEIQTEGLQIHWSLDDEAGNHQRTSYPDVGNGEWHHTAMIVNRDDDMLVSYMDGADKKTVNIANIDSVTGSLPVTFGGGYRGSIDESALFNVALEEEDILDIMNLGLAEAVKPEAVSPSAKLATTWGRVRDSR